MSLTKVVRSLEDSLCWINNIEERESFSFIVLLVDCPCCLLHDSLKQFVSKPEFQSDCSM